MKPFNLLLLMLPMSLAAQSINLEEWQEKWDNSKEYTTALLHLANESMLDFKPTEEQMSLRAQLGHIAGNMYFLSSRFLGHQPEAYDQEAQFARLGEELTIDEMAEELEKAYQFASDAVHALKAEQWDEEVDFFVGKKTRRVIAWLLQDHATHHRGQLIVYMRLQGVEELPRYKGW